MTKHVLSVAGLAQEDFLELIERGAAVGAAGGIPTGALVGHAVGLEFRKTSTRTRISFATAASRLGATPIMIGPNDLQTNTGETIEDTVRVLGGYLSALVVRTAADPAELHAMAAVDRLPIVNAMTSDEHPTQAISDLAMMRRHFGRLHGLKVLYVGEGNNTAASLALAVARMSGMQLTLHTPPGYGLRPEIGARVAELSREHGGQVSESTTAPRRDGDRFDVLYTTRWQTTGTSKPDAYWRERFAPYSIDNAMMDRLGAPGAVFMHDLPAVRGEDCEGSLLDGPRSIAFEQARQKLFTAMAVLSWCTE
jgi:ornithine carbamoyltransferase